MRPGTSAFIAALAEPARLREAWSRVAAARGAAGVDGLAIDRIEPSSFVETLARDLAAGRYRPAALRRAEIPKASGGVRLLGIPVVADRVVQSAAAELLDERWAAEHHASSFAYRRGSSAVAAARAFERLLHPGCWVVTADIERFFDAVDHGILLGLLHDLRLEADGIRLVEGWIRAPIVDRAARYQPVKGIPQGGPISPLLANLFLTGFDRALAARGNEHLRYADDFVIVEKTETAAKATLAFVVDWLHRHRRLTIKPAKTQFVALTEGCSFVGFWFTPGTRGLPVAKRDEFMSRVQHLTTGVAGGADLGTFIETHNRFVAGWRAYYAGLHPHLDTQLEDLDRWRSECTGRALASRGLDAAIADVILQHLVRSPALPISPDPYAYAPAGAPSSLGLDWMPDDAGVDPWRVRLEPVGATSPAGSGQKALRVQAGAASQPPTLLAGQSLHVPTHGAYLTKRYGTLVVRRQKSQVFECAFDDIRHVAVEAEGVGLSGSALAELARRRVSVLICGGSGVPLARIVPVRNETRPALAERQIAMRNDTQGTRLASQMLTAKILNQRALLLYHSKYASRPESVRQHLGQAARHLELAVEELTTYEERSLPRARTALLLVEARAAIVYWRAFGLLVPESYQFAGRRKQGVHDPVNAALNYGYWLLMARTWQALEKQGLHAYLGFLHTSRHDLPGLVFDAMEEFRAPLVDRAVIGLVGRRAHLAMKGEGMLTTRARVHVAHAVSRALERRTRGRPGRSVIERLHLQARRLRAAVATGTPYRGFRMQW
jgi:RNA-directed DNA polymerase